MPTLTTHKGYIIETVGISRNLYRPGVFEAADPTDPAIRAARHSFAHEQSMAAAKRRINVDIAVADMLDL